MKLLKHSLLALTIASTLTACSLEGDDGTNGIDGQTGTAGIDGTNGTNGQDVPTELMLEVVGRFSVGGKASVGKSAAEIVQFHQTSNSAFSINGADNQIEVISLESLPTTMVGNPISDTSLTSRAFTFASEVTVVTDADASTTEDITLGGVNSLAISGDLMVIAVAADNKQADGAVLFYTLDAQGDGTFVKAVKVGALPDMVTFSNDGTKVLVANEGEPNADYSVDPEGTISIINVTDNMPSDVAMEINLTTDMTFSSDLLSSEDYDTDAKRMELLKAAGLKFAGPDGTTVAQSLEPEYIAVSADDKVAYLALQENNAIGIINLEDMSIEVKALGFKDWGMDKLDVTNKDEVANLISINNLFGMYQPDTIATYQWNGATFVVSANEGDARDYDGYSEEVRVKDIIDPDEVGAMLSTELMEVYDATGGKDGLGRLKVTTALGDADNDGTYEALYAYGGRSFSIWDQNVNQVFDSGSDFERISAAILGSDFNSTHTENKGDNRSDDKGGEPEAVAVGEINGRMYSFIGLERSGDLFAYDVTNPFNVSFVAHYNNRDFSVDYELDDDLADPCDAAEGMNCDDIELAGDLGPESIKFVHQDLSPNGNPLLIIGNEVSGTVTVYQVSQK